MAVTANACKQCETSFESSHPFKIFCDRKCAVKAANDRRPIIGTYLSVCEFCDGEYENNSHQSLYCSTPCKSRAADLRRRLKDHGLTSDDYIGLLEKQNYRCGICNSPDWGYKETSRSHDTSPRIDHDHDTGRVRGLLCNRCNLGVGMLNDDVMLLRKATEWVSE